MKIKIEGHRCKHRFVTLSDHSNLQITCTQVSRCDILSRMHRTARKARTGREPKKGKREREREKREGRAMPTERRADRNRF